MAINRTNAGRLVNKITLDLDKVRFFFEQAFLAGKEETFNCSIFKLLWRLLAGVETFENIQELEIFYTNIEAQLPHYIEDFCAQLNQVSQEKISIKLINLLTQVVRAYHLLIKQQFYAQRFVEHNSVFDEQVATLKKESLSIAEVIKTLNQNELERFIESYIKALSNIITRLNKGYEEMENPFAEKELDFPSDGKDTLSKSSDLLIKINAEVDLMPSTQELNEEIDKLREACMTSNKDSVDFYRIKIKNNIKLIADIKNNIQVLLTQCSQQLNAYFTQLTKQIQILNESITKVDAQYQEIKKVFFSALTIQGYGKNDLVVSQGYQALFEVGDKLNVLCKIQENDWFTMGKGINTKVWDRTGENVSVLIHGVAADLEKLVFPYVKSMIDIDQLHEHTQKNARLLQNLNSLQSKMQTLKIQSEKLIPKIQIAFKNIEHNLYEHVENTFHFFKLFGIKHWKEMTVGTLSGAGSGVALAFLTAVPPVSLAFLIPTGILMGFSAGGGIGLARDHFFAKKPRPPASIASTAPASGNTMRP